MLNGLASWQGAIKLLVVWTRFSLDWSWPFIPGLLLRIQVGQLSVTGETIYITYIMYIHLILVNHFGINAWMPWNSEMTDHTHPKWLKLCWVDPRRTTEKQGFWYFSIKIYRSFPHNPYHALKPWNYPILKSMKIMISWLLRSQLIMINTVFHPDFTWKFGMRVLRVVHKESPAWYGFIMNPVVFGNVSSHVFFQNNWRPSLKAWCYQMRVCNKKLYLLDWISWAYTWS